MFIGHYAIAPLAAITGKVKLWHGFLAVQFIDVMWAIFIFLGIEKARIVPGLTQASPMDLHFMPYTHSLLFCAGWAVIGALIFKVFTKSEGWKGAALIGLLVMSHWFEDLIVHIPDLTLWPGSEKYGLGLWRYVMASFPLEIFITFGAFAIYLAKTKPLSSRAKLWAGAFFGVLLSLQIISNFGPPPGSAQEVAMSALIAYALLAFMAARFERTRVISAS